MVGTRRANMNRRHSERADPRLNSRGKGDEGRRPIRTREMGGELGTQRVGRRGRRGEGVETGLRCFHRSNPLEKSGQQSIRQPHRKRMNQTCRDTANRIVFQHASPPGHHLDACRVERRGLNHARAPRNDARHGQDEVETPTLIQLPGPLNRERNCIDVTIRRDRAKIQPLGVGGMRGHPGPGEGKAFLRRIHGRQREGGQERNDAGGKRERGGRRRPMGSPIESGQYGTEDAQKTDRVTHRQGVGERTGEIRHLGMNGGRVARWRRLFSRRETKEEEERIVQPRIGKPRIPDNPHQLGRWPRVQGCRRLRRRGSRESGHFRRSGCGDGG